ncbi:MAG: sodium-translocating pyrophosphatase [Clostridiaceae bacterium]|nr:sodium-translocating pyrophosphatase [Clostridiaceae bacterium]
MDQLTVILIVSFAVGILAFIVAWLLYRWLVGIKVENKRAIELSKLIREGSNTFLKREYRYLAYFSLVVACLILLFLPKPIWQGSVLDNITMTLAYISGTAFSGLAGKIGIAVATRANVRSAEAAAKHGISLSFLSGFRGGAVMGMAVVGASLLGVCAIYALTGDALALLGFSFGASSMALFAKAGGGIFTKTADISADLVGKVTLGMPEDDPRNPAVIADNVGDNVGDVAGMGADLFDSNVAAMAAALVMGISLDQQAGGNLNIMTVFCYATVGLLASIIGVGTARLKEGANPTRVLNFSTYVTTIVYLILTAGLTALFNFSWRVWGAAAIGLAVGLIIGLTTDYFTNDERPPVRTVAKMSKSGPAFTILSGISYSFISVLPAMLGIAVAALLSYTLCSPLGDGYAMYGIAMSAVGMLSIVGMIISNDAYGPIVDNARGLVEMADLGDEALEITDELDSAGNTVKAITKGFAIGAAGLTVISMLGAYMTEVNVAAVEQGIIKAGESLLEGFDIINPLVFFGLIVGAAVPAVFSAMLMRGVDRNAVRMVKEIHRQFDEIEGLKEGKEGVVPEYDKCISIATNGALRELIPAGLFAIVATIVVGFIGGVSAIGGFLTGNIVSGLLLSLFMSNAGGLWDNAKKYIEAGNCGGTGSEAHKAAVVGDTVGDPFKDTAGPSINTQITVVSLLSSLMASIFLAFSLFG